MKFFRITDHHLYRSLSKEEQLCYRNGLPIRFMKHKIRNMVFVDYHIGREMPKLVSAPKQKSWTTNLKNNMTRHNNQAGVIGCYSTPTDTAAFECAGSIFEAGVKAGMSCTCISAATIALEYSDIPKNDLYVIHGITDNPDPSLDRRVKSFLYERDGSLRILVMAGSDFKKGPWAIAHDQLRIRLDVLLMLNDDNELNTGNVEKAG